FEATFSGKPGRRLFNFRNSLVFAQFVLLVGLLSVTWYIHQQMDYVQTKDLGFEKEGVLFFDLYGAKKYQQIKPELLKIPAIKAVGSGMVPGHEMYNQLTYKMKNGEGTFADGTNIYTDAEVFDVLGIPCAACKDLKNGKESVFVINQTAANKLAKSLNIEPKDLIGQTLISEPEYENEENGFGFPYVIGDIIADYDYFSLKYPSQPLLINITATPSYSYGVILKAESTNWPRTVAQIEAAYKKVETEQPFVFNFMSDHLDKLYLTETRAGLFMSGLSIVAVILALMGLAGIVSYVAFNRRKEVAIRKVFGASTSSILWLMNKDFFMMMSLAVLVATPIALYLAKAWLSSFAYQITVNPLVVVIAGLAALALVIVVVSIQSRATVEQNPIDNLKRV
ncbi:MAG: FtsX-like permease family protein, partial [Bacteroidota bacterium]